MREWQKVPPHHLDGHILVGAVIMLMMRRGSGALSSGLVYHSAAALTQHIQVLKVIPACSSMTHDGMTVSHGASSPSRIRGRGCFEKVTYSPLRALLMVVVCYTNAPDEVPVLLPRKRLHPGSTPHAQTCSAKDCFGYDALGCILGRKGRPTVPIRVGQPQTLAPARLRLQHLNVLARGKLMETSAKPRCTVTTVSPIQ